MFNHETALRVAAAAAGALLLTTVTIGATVGATIGPARAIGGEVPVLAAAGSGPVASAIFLDAAPAHG